MLGEKKDSKRGNLYLKEEVELWNCRETETLGQE